tara:strand:- start:11493 stop:12395 length:903 start_codon:yes stop_codon:yes gene_type:complete
MSDDSISPYLAEIEGEVAVEAAGNPNNAVAFDMESGKNTVVDATEVSKEDYNKYLTSSQRNSLPKHLQEGIIRKAKTSAAEEDSTQTFSELANDPDFNTITPESEPAPEETSEPSIHDPELGPTEMGGPEEMTGDEILDSPLPVELLAERLQNQDQEMVVASMTQKQFEDWMFPEEGHTDWASGQIALARIMANLKAAGYDAANLSLDDQLYPAYVQIASSLWSRQNLSNPLREDVLSRVENAPAAQLVATLQATASAVPADLAAELFRAPIEQTTNYMPYIVVGVATLMAATVPFFWKR